MAVAAINSAMAEGDFPFVKSEARRMLAAALEAASADKGWSQRHVAGLLGYKSSVTLSHMATGRAPIPIERAAEYARLLKMPTDEFTLAVLNQRYPDIDFLRLLKGIDDKRAKRVSSDSQVKDELEALAGSSLDELPQAIVNVLRDVVSDRHSSRRWMQLHEIPVVDALRGHFPDGMSVAQRKELIAFIEAM